MLHTIYKIADGFWWWREEDGEDGDREEGDKEEGEVAREVLRWISEAVSSIFTMWLR